MIPANELRIGNLIRDTEVGFRDYFKVKVGDIVSIATGRASEFAPIPLTPEILIACGFEYDKDNCLKLLSCLYWLNTGHLQIAINYAPLINAPCQYLHQLQNIIFALTGKDIEYRP